MRWGDRITGEFFSTPIYVYIYILYIYIHLIYNSFITHWSHHHWSTNFQQDIQAQVGYASFLEGNTSQHRPHKVGPYNRYKWAYNPYKWPKIYGCFLKWWYPTSIGLILKMIILGCLGGTTILGNPHMDNCFFFTPKKKNVSPQSFLASRNVQRGVLKGAYKQPQGSFRRCLTTKAIPVGILQNREKNEVYREDHPSGCKCLATWIYMPWKGHLEG